MTAELVFVNYGVPKDYEELERRGIDVKGKIVIAKYGGSWRGIKPKVAAEKGAIGCLIYSDPKDDGYGAGRRVPQGPVQARNRRPARLACSTCPPTPATRSRPATARPKTPSASTTKPRRRITQIPVLPISYGDAQPLLAALAGPDGAGRLARRRCPFPTTSGRGRPRCT